MSAAVASYAETLSPPPGDPRGPLLAAAAVLAGLLDQGIQPAATARELRIVISDVDDATTPPSQLDELRAQRATRRARLFLDGALRDADSR